MTVLLHLVAKPGEAPELERRLRTLGFGEAACLPGERVVLRAEPEALRQRLGLNFETVERQRRVGHAVRAERTLDLVPGARLTPILEPFVERFFLPLAGGVGDERD